MFLLASQTANTKAESVTKQGLQPSISTRWVLGEDPYHKYSQRPPVCTLCVSSPVDHLRGHILHRTTEGIRLLVSVHRLFAQAKVCTAAKSENSEAHGRWNSRIHEVKQSLIPVNFICPASSSKMLKDKNMITQLSTKNTHKD